MKKDILIFFSDQHSYRLQGYTGTPIIRTPWMDYLAANGTVMNQSMTSCPLCTPARMSFMSGQYASRIGVLDNASTFHSCQTTFAHCLNAVGYETVLCGRMHFLGPDQRHGFSKRVAEDRTPLYVNQPSGDGHSAGVFKGFMEEAAIHYMGPGDSPVLAYDRYVVSEDLQVLGIGKYSLGRMVRHKQWRYYEYSGFDNTCLFDCENNPEELVNVADAYPELVKEFKEYLESCPDVGTYFEHKKWLEDMIASGESKLE